MNKKTITAILGSAFLIFACSYQPSTDTQPDPSALETIVASTLQAMTQQAPASTPQQESSGITASYQNVSFVIPESIASAAEARAVPAADETQGGPWGVAPEYIEFVLVNYQPRDDFLPPVIRIYPAQEYATVNPWAQSSLTKLQGVLASPSMLLTNENLPAIPFNGAAAQQYAAQAKRISFSNGNGVRMISQYAQYPAPITKSSSYFHYEGLTNDGKYLVAIMFPITLPIQSTFENPSADGVVYPNDLADANALTAYFQGVTDLLNAASPESYQPNLNLLDELIQSIQVK